MARPFSLKAEGFRTASLCAALAVFVPAGLLAKITLVPVFGLLAVSLLGATALTRTAQLRPMTLPGVVTVVLVVHMTGVLGLLSACSVCSGWAPGKALALALAVWTASCGAAAGLGVRARRRVAYWLIGGLGAAVALLLFENATGGMISLRLASDPANQGWPLVRYNRATSALVLLAWPAAGWLWSQGRRGAAWLLIALVTGVACIGDSASAATAALLAVGIFALACHAPRAVLWCGVAFTAGLAATAPWLFLALPDWLEPLADTVPATVLHRVEIWHATATAILDRPLLGHGVDATRELDLAAIGARPYQLLTANPIHPHSLVLQLWLDLGLVGVVAAGLLLWCTIRRVTALPDPWRSAALAAAAAGVFTALVSYGIWQETWLCIAAITVLAFRALTGDAGPQGRG